MDYFYSPFKLTKGDIFPRPYTLPTFPFSLFLTKKTGPRISLYMLLYLVGV